MPILLILTALTVFGSDPVTTQLPQPLKPGASAPEFSLVDMEGNRHALSTHYREALVVVMFVSTQCPISNDYNERMAGLDEAYRGRGVRFLGINSNRGESAGEIREHAAKYKLAFPILKDEENILADAFGAQVTPEIFVVDRTGTIRYHGRIDDSRDPDDITSEDLRAALDALLDGKEPPRTNTKAFGCGIKRVKK